MTDVGQDRWLQFDGLSNARDIGGLPLTGGGHVRPGVLLRTEALDYLSPADVRRLLDVHGVRQVLDLRTDRERVEYGRGELFAAGVDTHLLSFIPEEGRALPEVDEDLDPMVRNYLAYLDDRAPAVVEGVRRVARIDDGATVVHCAAGKDRTGIVIGTVLAALGVPREQIVADYLRTNDNLDALWARLRAAGAPEPDHDSLLGVEAAALEVVLDELADRPGGVHGRLLDAGTDPFDLRLLAERLLAPAGSDDLDRPLDA